MKMKNKNKKIKMKKMAQQICRKLKTKLLKINNKWKREERSLAP